MKSYKVTIVDGEPVAEERSFTQALVDSVTTLVSSDQAVVGIAPTLVTAGLAYGMGVLIKHRHTGELSFNPF